MRPILTHKAAFDNDAGIMALPDGTPVPYHVNSHFKLSEAEGATAIASINQKGTGSRACSALTLNDNPRTRGLTCASEAMTDSENLEILAETQSFVSWGVFDVSQNLNPSYAGDPIDSQGIIHTNEFGGAGFNATAATFKFFNVSQQTRTANYTKERKDLTGLETEIMRVCIAHAVSGGNRELNVYDILPSDIPDDLVDKVNGVVVAKETAALDGTTGANAWYVVGAGTWKIPTYGFGQMIFEGDVPTDIKKFLIALCKAVVDEDKPDPYAYWGVG